MTSRVPGPSLYRHLATIERELRPDADRVSDAKGRARRLIANLHKMDDAWMFDVMRSVPHGSHGRDTAIRGFKDIDYLLVLNPTTLRTLGGEERSARDTVERLAKLMRQRWRGLVTQGTIEVRSQEHSVGVKYPVAGLRVDIVPALVTRQQGCFIIPNRVINEWIETRPYLLKGRLTLAEKKSPRVRGAIRLIKGWRRARGKAMQIPSYAIELMLIGLADVEGRLEGLVRGFFSLLAEAHAGQRLVLNGGRAGPDRTPMTLRDPWSGANVVAELETAHRRMLVENARIAISELNEAVERVGESRDRVALAALRRLFIGRKGAAG